MLSQALGSPIETVRVIGLFPFGLKVSLNDGRTGVIREREIAWDAQSRQHWREHFKLGDVLDVVLLQGNQRRLEFSLRLVQHDPWEDLLSRYQLGQLVEGVVTGVQPYAVFIEIELGITGLLHRSRLPYWFKGQPVADLFWPGDRLKVVIELLDPLNRRLRLSLSRAWNQRWDTFPKHLFSSRPRAGALQHPRARSERGSLERLLKDRPRRWSILVVEDNAVQREVVVKWLQQSGQHTLSTTSAEEALALLEHERPDLVFIDFGLPQMNGLQAIRQIRQRQLDVKCILMTDWTRANEHERELDALRDLGAQLLIKPFLPEDLLNILVDPSDSPTLPSSSSPHPMPITANLPVTYGQGHMRLNQLLVHLAASLPGTKVVLFGLELTQRKIHILAETGPGELYVDALVDLVYSPVRDVAEDQRMFKIEDAQHVDARIRYLKPFIAFRSGLGIPVPGDLPERYALFIFDPRPHAFTNVYEALAKATTIAISALLEHLQFQSHTTELQRLALLGQLSRALVHEVNNHLGPINFALNDFSDQFATIVDTINDPGVSIRSLKHEVDEAHIMLPQLLTNLRRLTETARLFGQVTTQRHESLVSLDMIAAEVMGLVRDLADRANVTIHMPATPPLMPIRTQAAQVQQILLNIVLNAIQQIALAHPGEGGQIHIRIAEKYHNQNPFLEISVEDDGPGIHRRLWDRIFDLGFTTRQEGGSGLGLYIARSLVEALGGRIHVASSFIAWGTTLTVEFPITS